MIGHYLLSLTTEQEDRLLTQPMGEVVGCHQWARAQPGCVLQVSDGDVRAGWVAEEGDHYGEQLVRHVGDRYDNLLRRFGSRLNAAIRNRILSNRARRLLQSEVPVLARAAEPHNINQQPGESA